MPSIDIPVIPSLENPEVYPDAEQVRAHFDVLTQPGEVREVRILDHVPASGYGGTSTASGYFDDSDSLASELSRIDSRHATGIYITQNPVDPDLLARANNRLKRRAKHTTTDADIIRLAHLTLDFDPVRKSGISATDEELAAALTQRDAFIRFVTTELGWPAPIVSMMSGNGGQATWRIDLPIESAGLVAAVLSAARMLFSTEAVSVDTTLANPSRIVKLSGTVAGKGDPLPHRPHRRAQSTFLSEAGSVSDAQMRALMALSPTPEPMPPPRNGRVLRAGAGAPHDLAALLQAADIGFREREKPWGRAFELDRCLNSDEHSDGAAILQFPNGAVAYKCHHNRCAGVGWQDVKPQLGIETPEHAAQDGAGGHDSKTVRERALQTASRVRFITAREFAAETPSQTPWIIEPFVPVGGITKVDGAPKASGKTTLITHMVAAVLNGTDFLGRPTRKGPVVLLTEQGSTSFRESLKRAGLLDSEDLHLAIYRDFASLNWPEVVAQALQRARDVGAVLLVVDTLPACAGVRGDDENSAGRALEVMEPILVGADAVGLGVIVSFHDKKGGGEVGESGRGSSAYTGAVDVVLRVRKPGGNLSPTIRKIEALSRFEATPPELYIELTDAGYVSLGSESDVVSGAIARTLVQVLPVHESDAILIEAKKRDGEIVERGLLDALADVGVKAARSTLDAELDRWMTAGYVARTGQGRKGSPYRYWMITRPPAEFFRSQTADPSEERNEADSQTPALRGHQAQNAGKTNSSDDLPPSEERNRGDPDSCGAAPLLSSDAPAASYGRNEPNESPGHVCLDCGTSLPVGWIGFYCELHGGRPPDEGEVKITTRAPETCGKPSVCSRLGSCVGFQQRGICPLAPVNGVDAA